MFATNFEVSEALTPPLGESARFSRLLRLVPSFQLLNPQSVNRGQAEIFIGEKFQEVYGAELHDFLPQLLTMQCAGKLSGVAGISPARGRALFLEQYLDKPVEQELAALTGKSVRREEIVEIGNLVAANNGASLALFIVLASLLQDAGFTTLVFTLTEQLRNKFHRLGFEPLFIADAEESELAPGTGSRWGSYYQQRPQVMAGNLQKAVSLIDRGQLYTCIRMALDGQIRDLGDQFSNHGK